MKFTAEDTDDQVIAEVAKNNPEYFIGGYNIDNIILAMWYELKSYGLTVDEIHDRIKAGLAAMYAGLLDDDAKNALSAVDEH